LVLISIIYIGNTSLSYAGFFDRLQMKWVKVLLIRF